MKSDPCYQITLSASFDEAIEIISGALKKEGFGILTRVDVHKTLKEKLDVDFRPYVILGACNPSLAYQALSADPKVGLMMPCNVTVEALEEGGIQVCFTNPAQITQFVDEPEDPELQDAATRGESKMLAVIKSLHSDVK